MGCGIGGVVGEDRIAFVEDRIAFVEERRALSGIIELFVRRGRNGGVGGAGDCIGCRNV